MPGATGFCDCSSVRAHQGTLFLDEVGDIPFELQPKPLRVLQEKEFERMGGTQTQQVNVRVVAATSRDLPQMVAERQFRNDLYYRLNVFPVRLPPLRERAEDIPLLVSHFVNKFANQMNKQVETVPPVITGPAVSASWKTSWNDQSSSHRQSPPCALGGTGAFSPLLPFSTTGGSARATTLEEC